MEIERVIECLHTMPFWRVQQQVRGVRTLTWSNRFTDNLLRPQMYVALTHPAGSVSRAPGGGHLPAAGCRLLALGTPCIVFRSSIHLSPPQYAVRVTVPVPVSGTLRIRSALWGWSSLAIVLPRVVTQQAPTKIGSLV